MKHLIYHSHVLNITPRLPPPLYLRAANFGLLIACTKVYEIPALLSSLHERAFLSQFAQLLLALMLACVFFERETFFNGKVVGF
jgi:hypothetical protein